MLDRKIIILAVLSLIVLLVHIDNIWNMSIPTIMDDEYGYWGNAAYLVGINWSSTVSKIPYYSFGYSLLLIPFFLTSSNTIFMYKAAILLNGIMASASFLICYDIANKIIKNRNQYFVIMVSFLISMYPTYIAYSNIAWSECLLMFVCWMLTWFFLNLKENTSIYVLVLLGTLSGYIYMVHQRTIGILAASIIVILVMKKNDKINTKQFLCFWIALIITFLVHINLKNNIQSNLWLNNLAAQINDYSGQIVKIKELLTLGGILKALKVFLGQVFYLGASTFLLFYYGFYELLQKVMKPILGNFRTKDVHKNDNFYMYMFILISISFSILISVIFFINPIRTNEFVFGRYSEIIIGPAMLVGFAYLSNKENISNRVFIIIAAGFSIVSVIVNIIIKTSGIIECQTVDIVGLFAGCSSLGIFFSTLLAIFICRLLIISIKSKNTILINFTILIISCICMFFGIKDSDSIAQQNLDRIKISKVVDTIKTEKEQLPIYFLMADTESFVAVEWNKSSLRDRSVSDYYQFILKDKIIQPVNEEELSKISGDKLIITTKNMFDSVLLKNCELLTSDDGSFLFISNINRKIQ
jgi:hypothetical protein